MLINYCPVALSGKPGAGSLKVQPFEAVVSPFSDVYIATTIHPNKTQFIFSPSGSSSEPCPSFASLAVPHPKHESFPNALPFHSLANDNWKTMLSTRQHHANAQVPNVKIQPPPMTPRRLSNRRERPLHGPDTISPRQAAAARSAKGHGGVW